eukprot:CAMPEP_0172626064 /NCGR_PEP_ID=MMETSP1068-20121228/147675_1 /TAXON_ID=35684 /ORGANISM="Pseudopedinella elastica, Strain CCMP716" /LENGTH=341 /DNA_ID=CAMNT_0013435567 /DNA_START=180 /DNA_END=1205 /DNA_ORIENTATION=-
MSTTLPGSSHQTSSSFEVHKSTAASKPASAPVSSSRSVRLNKPLGLVLEEIDAGRPGARVKELKPGSNAAGRGINAGDVLVSINGEDCTAKSFTEVVDLMVRATETVDLVVGECPGEAAPVDRRLVQAAHQRERRSKALPWAECPQVLAMDARAGVAALTRTGGGRNSAAALAGNAGFDPLGLATDRRRLLQLRDAELKHGRLAMVAAVGWPLAEAWDSKLAQLLGLPDILASNGGLNPSLLNGGLLDAVNPWYWVGVVLFTAWVEGVAAEKQRGALVTGDPWLPGDLGFDPLGLYPKDAVGRFRMLGCEVKHGRLAMLAVTGFAFQEALLRTPVIDQPIF